MVNNSKYYRYKLYNREINDMIYLKSHTSCNHLMSRSSFNKLCNKSKSNHKGYILEKLKNPILDTAWSPKKHISYIFKISI